MISVLWRSLRPTGYDHCLLYPVQSNDGAHWFIEGTVLSTLNNHPLRVYYRVAVDEGWQTLEFGVDVVYGAERRSMRVAHGDRHRWYHIDGDDRREIKVLRGCTDVDLAVTPATNTLPIRRLNLRTRQSAHVQAVWLVMPSLDLIPVEQVYTRLPRDRYRYESATGDYHADIEVDRFGLVVDYPGEWVRISSESR